MSEPLTSGPAASGPAASGPAASESAARRGWLARRRDRMVAEIERNRRGGHRVPTWVLALALVAMIALWAAVILLS